MNLIKEKKIIISNTHDMNQQKQLTEGKKGKNNFY